MNVVLWQNFAWQEPMILFWNIRKRRQKAQKNRRKTVLIIQNGQEFAIQKRPESGLLAGLYELPNRAGYLTREEAIRCVEDMKLMPVYIKEAGSSKHIFLM